MKADDEAFDTLMGLYQPPERSNSDLMVQDTSACFSERAGFTAVTDVNGFSCQSRTQLELHQEKMRIIEKRKREYEEKVKKDARFANRKSFDELLGKLLKGDIVKLFAGRKNFPQVPLRFELGHQEYLRVWEKLFTYEVYNMLLNSRRSDSKDERPNTAGLEARH